VDDKREEKQPCSWMGAYNGEKPMGNMTDTPQRPLKVFLCHTHVDRDAVSELYQRLKGESWIDPWLDVARILPGQHWTSVIRKSLADADSIIILISNNSINREGFVQREMNYAWDLSLEKPRSVIYLIPLRLEDCEVPFDLRERQWADYFGERKEETYSALLQSLKLRHEQKLRVETEEYARQEKVRKEREEAEKARMEAEELAKQKAVKEKLERETDENTTREKAEREAVEKARLEAKELAKQKTAKEKLDREAKKLIDEINREKKKILREYQWKRFCPAFVTG
jgi:flagellar biosynthesis GTPase FlhF